MKASLLTAGALACTLASLASALPVSADRKLTTSQASADQKKADPRLDQALELKRKLTAQQQQASPQGAGTLATAGAHSGTISLVASGSDVCGTPTPISGGGPNAFDTAMMTTGAEGQTETACNFFATTAIENDAWFAWTSGFTGNAIVSLCTTATNDSKIAVYAGSGCPGAAALACNDDFCGLQSQLAFPATTASVYTLQIGKYPGSTDGAGTFSVTAAPPAPGNDLCASATAIAGTGSFAFSNIGALQDGPTNCGTFTGDVWYNWTAGATGTFYASTCGQAGFDTMLSVYDTSACQGPLLGCNDQFCVNESRVTFSATSGNVYKVQVGGWNNQTGSGTFSITLAPPAPANDLCASATAISGAGPHAFTNVSATTDGPSNCGVMTNDVWFNWTSGAAGNYEVSLCGMAVPYDSVISVYSGAGCPVGAPLACDDDFCFFIGPSKVVFTATAATVYKIQIGGYNGAEGSGNFTVQPPPPPPSNDVCATPAVIAGAGPHAFDTTAATTGTEGQTEGLCLAFSSTAVDNDIWYQWTAGSTGLASLSVCGQSTVDTKVGVYPGTPACPANGSALACNDDSCGLQSELCWNVTSGQTYTIQMGTFPGANGGAGTFGITVGGSGAPCQADDGTSEDLGSIGGPGESVWLMRMGASSGTTLVSNIQLVYGLAAFPGNSPPNGTATKVVLYDDPNDDGDASDAVLVQSVNSVVANVDTDIYNTVALTPVNMTGYFFVGAGEAHVGGQWVAPIDTSSSTCEGRAWIFGDAVAADYNNPGGNSLPIQGAAGHFGFGVNFLVRAGCNTSPMVGECFPGTGGVITCPCPSQAPANPAGGCANHGAGSTAGGVLTAAGTPSVGSDTLVITSSGMRPTASVLNVFFSYKPGGATPTPGIVSGAGVRCTGTGGSLKRLYTGNATGGSISRPGMGDLSVSAKSATFAGHAIVPPETRHYFNVYRDGQASQAANCNNPLVTTNLTNMGAVTWAP